VLFSSTARAHELAAIHDWVVICRDDHDGTGQWTVVTARYGPLQGRRTTRVIPREGISGQSGDYFHPHMCAILSARGANRCATPYAPQPTLTGAEKLRLRCTLAARIESSVAYLGGAQ
jgi:hypothetical protein